MLISCRSSSNKVDNTEYWIYKSDIYYNRTGIKWKKTSIEGDCIEDRNKWLHLLIFKCNTLDEKLNGRKNAFIKCSLNNIEHWASIITMCQQNLEIFNIILFS